MTKYEQGKNLEAFNRLYREMDQIYHGLAVRLGMSDSGFIILYTIAELGEGCLQKDIAAWCSLSRQTVNSSIQNLKAQGFLTLESGRGREKGVFLTQEGKSLIEKKIFPVMEMEKSAFEEMSPVLMMICTSFYSIVDGFFVSNYVGKTPFAALNLVFPVCMAFGTVGIMIGAGGELLEYSVLYSRLLFAALTPFVLQNVFQSFFVTAEKPGLSLKMSIAAGITNIVLDYLFIAVFRWGLAGAALATGIGQAVGGIIPLFYFARENDSLLRLTRTRLEKQVILKVFGNGSSEMVTNLSASIINILYNFQLMKLAGENGIAAYGIIMYVNFAFMAIYLGYAIGSSPVVGYHYGAGNHKELKNLLAKSLVLMGGAGILLTMLAELLTAPLVAIFANYDAELFAMTCHGFRLYALAFAAMGVNVFGSAFFTALGNGVISATISFLRTLLFQIAMIILLPVFLGIDGIWLAIGAAELLALAVTVTFLLRNRKKYHYA